jgi:DNA-binding CsgD family transcriptional regulator
MDEDQLRPMERRIRRLTADGVAETDIARRFRRSPEFVRRVLQLSALPDRSHWSTTDAPLRPIERRVLRWRDAGADHSEIARRFRRGPAFTQQVEDMARYKLAR